MQVLSNPTPVTQYTILWSTNIHELIDEVNEHLAKGWKLIGGVQPNTVAFYQSMTIQVTRES